MPLTGQNAALLNNFQTFTSPPQPAGDALVMVYTSDFQVTDIDFFLDINIWINSGQFAGGGLNVPLNLHYVRVWRNSKLFQFKADRPWFFQMTRQDRRAGGQVGWFYRSGTLPTLWY